MRSTEQSVGIILHYNHLYENPRCVGKQGGGVKNGNQINKIFKKSLDNMDTFLYNCFCCWNRQHLRQWRSW